MANRSISGLRLLGKKQQRSRIRKRCWFTGLPFTKKKNQSLTVEHLVPQCYFATRHHSNFEGNHVAAHGEINALIGHAPLKVKFALREYLHNPPVLIPEWMSLENKIQTYKNLTEQFLKQYQINVRIGQRKYIVYPWSRGKIFRAYGWSSTKKHKFIRSMLNEHKNLCAPEEWALISITGMKIDID